MVCSDKAPDKTHEAGRTALLGELSSPDRGARLGRGLAPCLVLVIAACAVATAVAASMVRKLAPEASGIGISHVQAVQRAELTTGPISLITFPALWVQPDNPGAIKGELNKDTRARTDRFGDPLPEGAIFRSGTLRARHDLLGPLFFSSDGRILTAIGCDNSVRMCDAATGKILRILPGHHEQVNALALSSDGRVLVSGENDGSFYVWEMATGIEKLVIAGHTGPHVNLALSSDGRLLVSSNGYEIRVWDTMTGKQKWSHVPVPGNPVWSADISPDGQLLVAGFHEQPLALWNLQTGEELPRFKHTNCRQSPQFLPDGKRVMAWGFEDDITIWQVATGQKLANYKGCAPFAVSRDCGILATYDPRRALSARDTSISLWDLASGKEFRRLQGHQSGGCCGAFSPDGKMLASLGNDHILRRWDVKTGLQLGPIVGHENVVDTVIFSPDGKTLASGSRDGTIRLWDYANGREIRRFSPQQERIQTLAFLPGGDRLVSQSEFWSDPGSNSGGEEKYFTRVRLREVATGVERRYFEVVDIRLKAAFSPRTQMLALGGLGKIHLLNLANGKNSRITDDLPWDITGIAFSADGRRLAITSDESGIRQVAGLQVREVSTGTRVWSKQERFVSYRGVAFTPDSAVLFTGGDKVRLWESDSGNEIGTLDAGQGCVAISHDGKSVATAGEDGSVLLWDLATRHLFRRYTGHVPISTRHVFLDDDGVLCLAFSPDDRLLATGGGDTLVIVYDLGDFRKP